jgi:hypothetical protein
MLPGAAKFKRQVRPKFVNLRCPRNIARCGRPRCPRQLAEGENTLNKGGFVHKGSQYCALLSGQGRSRSEPAGDKPTYMIQKSTTSAIDRQFGARQQSLHKGRLRFLKGTVCRHRRLPQTPIGAQYSGSILVLLRVVVVRKISVLKFHLSIFC